MGLPLAVTLGKSFDVVGFDIKKKRVDELLKSHDDTGEIKPGDLQQSGIRITDDPEELREASLIIVSVPTPITDHKIPDLNPLKKASETIGKNLSSGSIVVFESTVYPGVTENECAPIVEKHSGLKCGTDFKVGYSPERVNPGDKNHVISKIVRRQRNCWLRSMVR